MSFLNDYLRGRPYTARAEFPPPPDTGKAVTVRPSSGADYRPRRAGSRRVGLEMIDEARGISVLWYGPDHPPMQTEPLWKEQEEMDVRRFAYNGPATMIQENWPEFLYAAVPNDRLETIMRGGNLREVEFCLNPRPILQYALNAWDENPDTMVTVIEAKTRDLDAQGFAFDPNWPRLSAVYSGVVSPESMLVYAEQVTVVQPPVPGQEGMGGGGQGGGSPSGGGGGGGMTTITV